MRASATPSTVRALMDMNSLVDVRDALPAVRVPTLVLHRTSDPLFHVEEARYLADRIPGARLVLLDGADHLPVANPDQILDQIEGFLAGRGEATDQPLALAAVAAVAGEHGAALAADLVRRGGRLRQGPEGRALVLFDGPARAVRAGLDRLSGGARLGLSIAEVPLEAEPVEGPGVVTAVRLADAAPPGTLSVSATVAVLLSGSGIVLEPAGTQLDGEPVLRVVSA